jgi:hypothetical protein
MKKPTIIIVILLIVLGLGFSAYFIYHKVKTNSISLTTDDQIDVTPQQIRSIRDIGEWEFLSISDEQMVDTLRRGILFDDQLVRIYYGTLRLGIDMQQLREDAITTHGDTLLMVLPPVKLLDDHFIDEARTRSFISKGNWDPGIREALYYKAQQQMIDQCMTPQNIQQARENAEEQVSNMLRSMGFKQVKITFER